MTRKEFRTLDRGTRLSCPLGIVAFLSPLEDKDGNPVALVQVDAFRKAEVPLLNLSLPEESEVTEQANPWLEGGPKPSVEAKPESPESLLSLISELREALKESANAERISSYMAGLEIKEISDGGMSESMLTKIHSRRAALLDKTTKILGEV